VTKGELLERLHASRRPVTARQLERWSKASHLDRPVRRHIRGVRGSVSLFPARAFEQAAALYDAANKKDRGSRADRRLDERAFLMWWSGKAIVHDPRTLLLNLSGPVANAVENVRSRERVDVIGAQDSDDPAFDIADAYFQDNPPENLKGPLFSALASNLARSPQSLLSFMTTMVAGVLGSTPVLEPSPISEEPSLALLILTAFGFAQFPSTDTPEAQVSKVLQNIGLFAERRRVGEFVRSLTDEELRETRRFARVFFEDLPPIFEALGVLFGKGATARILRAYSRMSSHGVRASMTIAIAWLLRGENTDGARRLIGQIRDAAPKARAICAAAKAFPEYRRLFLRQNQVRLGALPEKTRKRILDVVKSALNQTSLTGAPGPR
jgi:hypothetical protein